MRCCTNRVIVLAFTAMLVSAFQVCAQQLQGPVQPEAPPPQRAQLAVHVAEPTANDPRADVRFSPNTGMPMAEAGQPPRVYSIAEVALMSSEYMDCRYVANSQYPDELGIWEQTCSGYGDQFHRLWNDAKVFYGCENLLYVGLVVAVAAPIANTRADQQIQDWYQRQAGRGQSRAVDSFADVGKEFGNYFYTVPALMAMSAAGHFFPDHALLTPVGEFGDRSLRAMAVGAPTIGILQVGLGAQRPEFRNSKWQPFHNSRSVSGHAFIGAIPFLTVASMTESRALKTLLIAGSTWTGWTRIHDNDHYFSQVLLGWSIAYLATRAVNQTESDYYQIVPMAFPNGMGLGVHVQY